MWRWIKRAETVDAISGLSERLFKWSPHIIAILATSGVSGWAASATSVFSKYSPFSWVGASLIGALIGVVILYFFSLVRYRVSQRLAGLKQIENVTSVNPLNNHFEGRRINISDFASPFPGTIKNKVFIGCELIGPGNIVILGTSQLIGTHFYSCDVVHVLVGKTAYNVIRFEDVMMRDCKLFRTTLYIPEALVDKFDKIPGVVWLDR